MNRHAQQRLGSALLGICALIVVVPILFVIGAIVMRGIGTINWEFLSQAPRDGMKAGLYKYGFRPIYNLIPKVLAKHYAYKFSVTAVKV